MTKDEQDKLITHCASMRLMLENLVLDIEAIERVVLANTNRGN